MISLLSLSLENFFAVEEETVTFNHQGVSLITGENGSSKTTLFIEGPFYALYGRSFEYGDQPGDLVRSRWAESMSVVITLVANGITYRISRYRGHKEHKNSVILEQLENGSWKDQSRSSTTATQAAINAILGLDADTFVYTSIFSDGVSRFPDLPDADKKKIISSILGLDGCDAALKLTKTKAAELEGAVSMANNVLKLDLSAYNEAKTRLADLAAKEQEWLLKLDAKKQSLTTKISAAETALASGPQVFEQTDTSKLRKRVSDLKELIAGIEKPLATATTIKSKFDDIKSSIQKLNKSSKCSECGREFSNATEVEAHVAELTKSCEKLMAELSKAQEVDRQKLTDHQSLKAEANSALDKANAKLVEAEKANSVKKEKAENDARARKALLSQLNDLRDQLDQLDTNPYADLIRADKELLAQAEEGIAEKTQSLDRLKAELEDERVMLTLFGKNGCRVDLLNAAIPSINLTLERLASVIDVPISVSLAVNDDDESFTGSISVRVLNQRGADRYHGNSRGERRMIDIMVLLALASSLQSSSCINQAFFDETFESLHGGSQAAVLRCIRDVFSNRQIYVIAHHHAGLEAIDRVLTVRNGKLD